jgi:hypothetical protein
MHNNQKKEPESAPKIQKQEGTYKAMTDAEILEAQRRLAECPPYKIKRK